MSPIVPAAPPASESLVRAVAERAARWYVFVFLNVYGLGKIAGGQFYTRGALPDDVAGTLLRDVSSFDLAWTFMGHSFAYVLFIGVAEVVGAWLLLWERTKLLGVAVLLPILVNILVFDVIFLDEYGALASATLYTALLLVVLALNREAVAEAVRSLVAAGPVRAPEAGAVRVAVLALVAMAVLFALDQAAVSLLGHGRGS